MSASDKRCHKESLLDPTVSCDAAIASAGVCLAHLNDQERVSFLEALDDDAGINMSGVTFSASLLGELISALTADAGSRLIGPADFSGATFIERANFREVVFCQDVNFSDSTFADAADFAGATFWRNAYFGATFTGSADFSRAKFARAGNFNHVKFTKDVDFSHAIFTQDAHFGVATLSKRAGFSRVTFNRNTYFASAIFGQEADFSHATFTQNTYFNTATFTQLATFSDATFAQANFNGVTFDGEAYFGEATFTQYTSFIGTTFVQIADFAGVAFDETVYFSRAAFGRDANFSESTFAKTADFIKVTFSEGANFDDARLLGPLMMRSCVDELSFNGAELAGELVADVTARELNAQNIRGSGSMTLRLRAGKVNLAGLVLSGPVSVQGFRTALAELDESDLADPASRQVPAASIDSLREVDVERLVLTDLDLTQCLFAGMHRVEQLRLDGQCIFATDPRKRRRTLAEEHHWRSAQTPRRISARISRAGRRAGGWMTAANSIEVVSPARLQVLYRQLRVATESSKNEPGAADFYYGEMEMRRHSKGAPWSERIIVMLYWLISGYGLRASRAITALAAAIAAATIIFATIGFAHTSTTIYRPLHPPAKGAAATYQQSSVPGAKPGWSAALNHAIDSSTSLLHTPSVKALTSAGRATEIALRLLGPVLLGLAVLAIRGRVKR